MNVAAREKKSSGGSEPREGERWVVAAQQIQRRAWRRRRFRRKEGGREVVVITKEKEVVMVVQPWERKGVATGSSSSNGPNPNAAAEELRPACWKRNRKLLTEATMSTTSRRLLPIQFYYLFALQYIPP